MGFTMLSTWPLTSVWDFFSNICFVFLTSIRKRWWQNDAESNYCRQQEQEGNDLLKGQMCEGRETKSCSRRGEVTLLPRLQILPGLLTSSSSSSSSKGRETSRWLRSNDLRRLGQICHFKWGKSSKQASNQSHESRKVNRIEASLGPLLGTRIHFWDWISPGRLSLGASEDISSVSGRNEWESVALSS